MITIMDSTGYEEETDHRHWPLRCGANVLHREPGIASLGAREATRLDSRWSLPRLRRGGNDAAVDEGRAALGGFSRFIHFSGAAVTGGSTSAVMADGSFADR